MSEFKRGDRVEAKHGNKWVLGIYLGNFDGWECVSVDEFRADFLIKVMDNEIRHPVKKVKVMMQDWLSVGNEFRSYQVDYQGRQVVPGMYWKMVGEPYEKELEVIAVEVPQ